ncbi:hypothetical protein RRG08_030461 [Elysia crispata]|uniref:Uncharacterized protein n=1 Tax=Elysia crispata TaxID=231223 RepID=A0AAE1E8A0_9GAST|nr:hypothetical protein RRG08_030461 [Elysia crispata]
MSDHGVLAVLISGERAVHSNFLSRSVCDVISISVKVNAESNKNWDGRNVIDDVSLVLLVTPGEYYAICSKD